MKKDLKTNWMDTDWSFQARRFTQGLNKFPHNAKIVLLLRHSNRKDSNDVKELENLGLTELGCEIAKTFGSSLPKQRPLRILHSPSPRCVETALKIIEGFQKVDGVSEYLGATSPLNETKSSKGFITTQALKYRGIEFIKRWQDNQFSKNNIIPFSEYCINVYDHIIEASNTAQEGGIDIHISHDLFIIALRYGWFNRMKKSEWVSFLGGFAVSFNKNQNFLLDLENHSLESIRLLNRKNIPVFKFDNKEGGKNRWEKEMMIGPIA